MKKYTSLLLFSLLLLFTACGSDDEPTEEPTIQEIQQDIENTFNGFVTCMQGYESGSFSNAFQTFMQLNNGEMNTQYSDLLVDELSSFDFVIENFDISNHSGIYNWNSTSEMWNFTANTNNKLVFNFPFAYSESTNNTTVVIDDYSVQQFVLPFETVFYPTKILGSIEKNNQEIFNVDLDNVTYRSNNDIVSPVSFNLEIRTEPMTHTFTLTENATNELEFDYNSHNDNSCSTTISLDAETTISDYAFVGELEEFSDISGKISHDNLEIRFAAQVDNLNAISEPTDAQINQLIEAKVYLMNSEVGELEYSNDIVEIVYGDGTRENVTNYVNQELADQLEAIFANYTN